MKTTFQEESIKAIFALPARAFLTNSPHPLLIFSKIYGAHERSQIATGWTRHLTSQITMSKRPIPLWLIGVVNQKSLYFTCHSGFDPESSIFELDSRFRGNDGSKINVKKR